MKLFPEHIFHYPGNISNNNIAEAVEEQPNTTIDIADNVTQASLRIAESTERIVENSAVAN